MKRNNTISASSAGAFATCPRRFFYSHELGWQPAVEARALTFGKAWHGFLERLAAGDENPIETMVESAEGFDELTEMEAGTLYAYAQAFLDRYHLPKIKSEVTFRDRVDGSRFIVTGRIDGVTEDGRIVEYKTTSSSIAPESDYWLRLKHNLQVLLYAYAAQPGSRSSAAYFVMRKPTLRPVQVPVLDAEGRKIVIDISTGARALNKDGSPRQSAGAGLEVQTREETADEFSQRLYCDISRRPEFYFAAKEVPLHGAEILQALDDIYVIVREVQLLRRLEKHHPRREHVWRRNCSEFNCAHCPYRPICLDTDYETASGVPEGFTARA